MADSSPLAVRKITGNFALGDCLIHERTSRPVASGRLRSSNTRSTASLPRRRRKSVAERNIAQPYPACSSHRRKSAVCSGSSSTQPIVHVTALIVFFAPRQPKHPLAPLALGMRPFLHAAGHATSINLEIDAHVEAPLLSVATLMSLTHAPLIFFTVLLAFSKPWRTASSIPFDDEALSSMTLVTDMLALLFRGGNSTIPPIAAYYPTVT